MPKAVEAFNIPAVEVGGYEADDVIGTLAQQWVSESKPNLCDRDRRQRYDGSSPTELQCGMARKTPTYRVSLPNSAFLRCVADLLGLAGDSSDNIPGCRDRTEDASTLLQMRFNGGIVASAARSRVNVVKTCRNLATSTPLAGLATIKVDVPVEVDAESFRMEEPDANILGDFLRQLNFKRILSNSA